MDIYVGYRNYQADIFGSTSGGAKANINDFQVVTTGAVIRF
jgi:hypothetical protein